MKIIVTHSKLLLALNRVSRAVSTGITSASLMGIMVDFYDDKMFLRATNGEIEIQTTIEAKTEGVGQFLVAGKLFHEIVKRVNSHFIALAPAETEITIEAGRSKFELKQLSKESFPKMKIQEWAVETELNILDLINLTKKTVFAASQKDNRAILQGVHFQAKDNYLRTTATDAFRVGTFSVAIGQDQEIDVVIPAASLNELLKIVNDGVITLKLNKTYAEFAFGDTRFQTRLIEGTYPNMKSFFEMIYICEAVYDRLELIQALERNSIMATEVSANIIKFDYDGTSQETKISSTANEVGSSIEEILAKNGAGSILLASSTKYLLDALKAFDGQEIKISFSGDTKPFVLTDEKEPTHKQLILPVKL